MDHNFDDSLNLESAIGVDFEHSEDTVVNQPDISLEATTHEQDIPMEFEQIEEQPILMETGNEEIIVSDFMGDQFTLQEYGTQEEVSAGTSQIQENVLTTQSSHMGIQFEPVSTAVSEGVNQPKVITIKAPVSSLPAMRPIAPKRDSLVLTKNSAPKQIAIAPKTTKIVQGSVQKVSQVVPAKQYAIAPKPIGPKPVAFITNQKFIGSKQAVGQIIKKALPSKGNQVFSIGGGKQVVVMGAGGAGAGAPKIKLVSTGGLAPQQLRLLTANDDQAQLIQNVATPQASGTMAKVITVQGSSGDASDQPAVITKLVPAGASAGAGAGAPRYVTMTQKTVPISISSNKVVLTSPTKSGLKYTKSQVVSIKPPTPTLVSSSTPQGNVIAKKVALSSNPTTHKVILKSTAPAKTGHIPRVSGQRTQLHPINVPGKGIQYIRLVTNPTQAQMQSAPKPQVIAPPSKTFVLTDGKGNVIQMTAEKVMSTQPPPLIVTSSTTTTARMSPKTPQKLVRLAPVSSKLGQAAMNRGGQSLLAPQSTSMPSETQPVVAADEPDVIEEPVQQDDEHHDMMTSHHDIMTSHYHQQQQEKEHDADEMLTEVMEQTETDSKEALRALIADTVGSAEDADETTQSQHNEVPVEFDTQMSPARSDSNSSGLLQPRGAEHPVIVIPAYMKEGHDHQQQYQRRMSGLINVEVEVGAGGATYDYPSPARSPSDPEMVAGELGLRPRKACNCTKSQCLKLYCDCFANGEFCNNCNCNNCHNNLENEELRQKAIRGCLDRNPNAFRPKYYYRPKIGKSNAGAENFRRHNKGCNCKRSGCLKNYCECYEAKIACTNICKCVGCRNVEESLERARRRDPPRTPLRPAPRLEPCVPAQPLKQPCNFMTGEVIEAVCQCLLAAAAEPTGEGGEAGERGGTAGPGEARPDPVRAVIEEFSRCLQDIISASYQAAPLALLDEAQP